MSGARRSGQVEPRRTLRARFVFPIEGPPLADGCVVVEGERIVAVERPPSGEVTDDLGNAAILPGLVNCHTHLEFSRLAAPLVTPGIAFPDWLRAVVAWRRSPKEPVESAVRAGLSESCRSGTAALGEIATDEGSRRALEDWPGEAVVFRELLGLLPDRVEPKLAEAAEHLDHSWPQRLRPGLAPHAPYTVHPELFARSVALAAESDLPLAFHLAESPAELRLLSSGDGPLVDLLSELGAWDPAIVPRGTRPLDYLERLAEAPRALVIHGNYLDPQERAYVAARADRLTLVYCPRTHAYFGHAPYPLAELIQRGASVALGTDSRASNPDLSLWEEMREVARRHAGLPLETVLRLGTICGARALGWQEELGSLRPGKLASLLAVSLPDRDARDPHELLFDSSQPPRLVLIRGREQDIRAEG